MAQTIFLDQTDGRVTKFTFPSGEQHLRISGLKKGEDVILVSTNCNGRVMELLLAVDICRRANVGKIILVLPFVPYARQDRVCAEGDPLSAKVFADVINSLNLDEVHIVDPHSEVIPALINNCKVIPQHIIAESAVMVMHNRSSDPLILVSPDLGASKKTKQLQKYILQKYEIFFNIIQCDKIRDPKTGKLTGFRILDGNPIGHHCLIVDDICDGGGTFLGLNMLLKEAGAATQSLCVTHGIFSKGIGDLSCFERIFTSTSLPEVVGTIRISIPNIYMKGKRA